jgi:cytochrome c
MLKAICDLIPIALRPPAAKEAWDVAAFINSQPKAHFDQSKDWPVLSKKSFDAPFGPYADSFFRRAT